MKKNRILGFILSAAFVFLLTGCSGKGDSYAEKGVTEFKEGNYEEALDSLNLAVKYGVKDFNTVDLYYTLGGVKFRLEDYEGSIEAYEAAIEKKPDDFGSWAGLGAAYVSAEDMENAANAYENAEKYDPLNESSSLFYVNYAYYFLTEGKTASAIEYLEKAEALTPENPYIYAYEALGYAYLYRYAESDEALLKAQELGYTQCDTIIERIEDFKNER